MDHSVLFDCAIVCIACCPTAVLIHADACTEFNTKKLQHNTMKLQKYTTLLYNAITIATYFV